MHVEADVHGDSFYEVTFQRKVGHGSWQTIGVDDSAPYQVFDDVSSLAPGRDVSYRAAVLDNAGHTRGSAARSTKVPRTQVTMAKPADGGTVSRIDPVALTATVDPERPLQSVEFQRSVSGGAWTSLGTDSSAPAYTTTDDVSALPLGTSVRYRAILSEHGSVQDTSAPVSVTTAPPQPAVGSVTVAGSLQSELGVPGRLAAGLRGHPPRLRHLGREVARHVHAAGRRLRVEGRDRRLVGPSTTAPAARRAAATSPSRCPLVAAAMSSRGTRSRTCRRSAPRLRRRDSP